MELSTFPRKYKIRISETQRLGLAAEQSRRGGGISISLFYRRNGNPLFSWPISEHRCFERQKHASRPALLPCVSQINRRRKRCVVKPCPRPAPDAATVAQANEPGPRSPTSQANARRYRDMMMFGLDRYTLPGIAWEEVGMHAFARNTMRGASMPSGEYSAVH